MKEALEALKEKAQKAIEEANLLEELETLRIRYLGKKGELTALLKGMGSLSAEERPHMGALANEVKEFIQTHWSEKKAVLEKAAEEKQLKEETIDVTLPGRSKNIGSIHPITAVVRDAVRIFAGLGFEVAEGPEIESDYYNFQALNLPPDHPAREMQDTFYINGEVVLRSQTSPVQVRTMEKKEGTLPVRIICPGKVYRRDDDATHSPMFHQIEGLLIGEDVTMAELKGVLLAFAKEMFGDEVKIRLRPSYFPFTEPSAEVDVSCVHCHGKGCRVCSHTGWLEILGSGMVHPNVLRAGGYDPEKVRGFAFGMGVERIAMLRYGINDLRLLFDNDVRFLAQF